MGTFYDGVSKFELRRRRWEVPMVLAVNAVIVLLPGVVLALSKGGYFTASKVTP